MIRNIRFKTSHVGGLKDVTGDVTDNLGCYRYKNKDYYYVVVLQSGLSFMRIYGLVNAHKFMETLEKKIDMTKYDIQNIHEIGPEIKKIYKGII